MLAKTVTLISFSLCSVVASSQPKQENPGAAYRVSVQAFNVISRALLKTLQHELYVNPFLIPDLYSGDASSNYSITDSVVQDFQVPRSNFTFRPPNEIAWSLKNIGFSLSFNWSYDEWVMFTSLRDSGSANFSVSGLSVGITVCLGRNAAEQLTLVLTKCSATVDKVSLDIDRAIYRFLLKIGLVQTMLEWKTARTVCDLVVTAIEEYNRNPMPSKYPIFSAAGYGHRDLIFDYGLVSDPAVTKTHLQMNHRGRFMLDGDQDNASLPAPKMTLPASKYMLTAAETNYPFNTLSDALVRSKYSSLYLTRLNLSTPSGSPLDTSCSNESVCFGTFFPDIANRYPNRSVSMLVNVTARPDLTINKDSFTLTAGHHVDFNITGLNGKETLILSVQLKVSVTGTAHIAHSTLFGKLTSVKLVFSSASSPFINRPAEFLRRLNKRAEEVMAQFVIRFNRDMSRGSPLPTKYPYIYLQAVNPQLLFIPGNILVNVDFDLYLPF